VASVAKKTASKQPIETSGVVKVWEAIEDGKTSWKSLLPGLPIMAIDPGPTESAIVILQPNGTLKKAKVANDDLPDWLSWHGSGGAANSGLLVVEMVASYGMAVGASVFDTCVVIGRIIEAYRHVAPSYRQVYLMRRADVKLQLCHQTTKVNDAVIRQRMIDEWGGKERAIGTKAKPGPLYGFAADTWQALALGVAFRQIIGGKSATRKGGES
jgi:hypothetical protein